MEEEQVPTEQDTARWSIDFDWYGEHNRSLAVLARKYLCPRCAKQSAREKQEAPVARVLATIRQCCGGGPGFITHRLPIMEAVFRIFLANGNQSLTIEELRKDLVERLGGDTYRTSRETLLRLLRNDRHYGIRQTGK